MLHTYVYVCAFAFMYVCVRLHEIEKGKWEGIKQSKGQRSMEEERIKEYTCCEHRRGKYLGTKNKGKMR